MVCLVCFPLCLSSFPFFHFDFQCPLFSLVLASVVLCSSLPQFSQLSSHELLWKTTYTLTQTSHTEIKENNINAETQTFIEGMLYILLSINDANSKMGRHVGREVLWSSLISVSCQQETPMSNYHWRQMRDRREVSQQSFWKRLPGDTFRSLLIQQFCESNEALKEEQEHLVIWIKENACSCNRRHREDYDVRKASLFWHLN